MTQFAANQQRSGTLTTINGFNFQYQKILQLDAPTAGKFI